MPLLGFAPSPFRLTFPLNEVFAHRSWDNAFKEAMVRSAQGASTVVIGEPGTGKTLLLQSLAQNLSKSDFSVKWLRPGDPIATLAETQILLIDEADLLDPSELERLCRLPNPIVMAGLPNFLKQLSSCSRLLRAVSLDRLGPEDIARFVRGRLAASDVPLPTFVPEAILALMQQSSGLFRLVTILAGAAVFFAEQRGSPEVTASDVHEAASLRASAFETPEESPTATSRETPIPLTAEVAGAASLKSRRMLVIAGWAGLMGACLGVIAVAVVAASATSRLPPFQIAGWLLPMVAAPVVPGSALLLVASPVFVEPPPVIAPSPPVVANLPLPPKPIPLPKVVQAEVDPTTLTAAPPDLAKSNSSTTEYPPVVLVFSGPIMNDTMQQHGTLSLKLTWGPVNSRVAAIFHASNGLIGSGHLDGAMGPDGKVKLAGKLMMGRNPFSCTLSATLRDGRLVGDATFTHQSNGAAAHSTFALSEL